MIAGRTDSGLVVSRLSPVREKEFQPTICGVRNAQGWVSRTLWPPNRHGHGTIHAPNYRGRRRWRLAEPGLPRRRAWFGMAADSVALPANATHHCAGVLARGSKGGAGVACAAPANRCASHSGGRRFFLAAPRRDSGEDAAPCWSRARFGLQAAAVAIRQVRIPMSSLSGKS